jgi:glycerol-3-phosphate dehydrogenase
LFVVTGGKLTTYRAMAEEVVNRLAASLAARFRRAVTHRVPLPGGDFRDVPGAIEAVFRVVGSRAVAERLVHAYGTRWPSVWERVQQGASKDALLSPGRPYLAGEVLHSVAREFAVTLADVLMRRVPIAFEERDHGAAAAAQIARVLAPHFGWSTAEATSALRDYERAAQQQFAID